MMALRQRDYVASSARRSEGSSSAAPEIGRRRTAKNMAANKPMKLTVACGARSLSARRYAPRAASTGISSEARKGRI